MTQSIYALVAATAACFFTCAVPAVAAQTQSCAFENTAAGLGTCAQGNGAAVSLDRSYELRTGSSATASSSARALAAPGVLKASVSSSVTTPSGFRNNLATTPQATASWTDNIIVNAGPTGTRGYFTAVLGVTGGMQGGLTGVVTPSNLGLSGSFFDLRGTGFSAIGGSPFTREGSYSDRFDFLIPVTIDFFNGFNTNLSYALSVSARAQADTESSGSGIESAASSNFGNSVLWGGITGVFDTSGGAVANYVITAESTFDYTTSLITSPSAVPEPATWAMLVVGFGMAGFAIRRRTAAVVV